MRHLLLVAALALCASAAATPTYCRALAIPDNVLPWAYRPVIRLAPGCPPGGFARVRKSSTLNVRHEGSPYQPIRPEVGAWNVTQNGSTIPTSELWTLITWRWEWWDGTRWRPAGAGS